MVKKLAGVPVWGWGIAALGAIALGLYFRHRAVVASSTGSSGQTGMDDLANSLAGGATDGATPGLDPALADLLSSALGAFNTGPGDPGFIDGGGFFDGGDGASGGDGGDGGSSGGDGGNGGQDAGGQGSAGASGAGTTWNPGPGYTGGGFLTLKQFNAGQSIAPYGGSSAQHPGANVNSVIRPTPSTHVNVGGNTAGGYTTYNAPPSFTPLGGPTSGAIRVSRSGFTAL